MTLTLPVASVADPADCVYECRRRWDPAPYDGLVVCCSDGRWGPAFDEFCREGLGLRRYDRFTVPGGPAWLTLRHYSLMKPYDSARDQLPFLLRAHDVHRVVLLTHYGCAFYGHILNDSPDGTLPIQEEDLRSAAEHLGVWCSGVQVEAYTARRNGDRLSFHRPRR